MKVFISQPIETRTKEEIKKERNDAIVKIRKEYEANAEILDSLFYPDPVTCKKVNKNIYNLARSLKLMATADIVVFIGNWKECPDCIFEFDIALTHGIPVIEL